MNIWNVFNLETCFLLTHVTEKDFALIFGFIDQTP